MSKMHFRGTRVEEVTFYMAENGVLTTEAKHRSTWSKPVSDRMGWTHETLGFKNSPLTGVLSANLAILTPNDTKKFKEFQISASKVHAFKHIAIIEGGEIKGHELEFVLVTVDPNAIPYFQNHLTEAGPADDRGVLCVNFDEQATIEEPAKDDKQGKLTEAEPEKARGRAASKEN